MTASDLFQNIDRDFLAKCKELMESNNDPTHDWEHAIDVARAANSIANDFDVPLTPLLLAAITHDAFSGIDRENHHLKAGEWVRLNLPDTVHAGWTEEVALCCEEHRASFTGEYSSIIQEAFASADRGPLHLNSIEDIISRSYLYATKKLGNKHSDAVKLVKKHLADKFAKDGYSRYPGIYISIYENEINALHDAIDDISHEDIERILRKKRLH